MCSVEILANNLDENFDASQMVPLDVLERIKCATLSDESLAAVVK